MSKNEKARAYEARQAEIHDQMTRMKTAKKEGSNQRAIRVAENFLKMGFSVEQVAKGSELTIEKVIEIKNKMIN